MRVWSRQKIGFLAAAMFLFALFPSFTRHATADDQNGDFDLYILSLSWSPEYCASHQSDAAQCAADKHFGLVVHGLWPQFASPRRDPGSGRISGWPANCRIAADPTPPEDAAAVWPSLGLYRHEWQTHGSCTGLDPAGYVALTKELQQRFQMPASLLPVTRDQMIGAAALRGAIIAANPGLVADDLTLVCRRNRLAEIRLCLARDGGHDYIACPSTVSNDEPCPNQIRIPGLGH